MGNWSIQANHSQVELIIIYGGGVGHEWARGSATVPFTVSAALPGDYNGSGAVNYDDYALWQSAFDTSARAMATATC